MEAIGPQGQPQADQKEPNTISKFSLRRYSIQHFLLMFLVLILLVTINAYAAFTGNVTLIALAGLTLALYLIKTCVVLYASFRTIGVEIWIRRMGMGDLEYRIEPRGRDEISLACEALETLRQSSIRAMELDLVRELSGQLQERNEELEQALADLQRAQDRIISQQKLAELGELTAGVAHEILNPLQFIENFARVAITVYEDLATEQDPEEASDLAQELKDNLQRIVSNAERVNRVVQDMTATARSGAGEFRPTKVNTLLQSHANLAYQSACAREPGFSADLQWSLDPGLDTDQGQITAVPEDIARVVASVVSNACHALFDRQQQQDGDPYYPWLRLSTSLRETNVRITVADNGVGMTPEVLEKIFNPFFTTRQANQGTGLGLSVSHDMVREHGGTIEVESRPGEGTEVTITLPKGDLRSQDPEVN